MMAQDIVGSWKTIDDNTGKAKSIIEIYKKGEKFYGKVAEILEPTEPNPICKECDEDDDRYKKPVLGMEILRGCVLKGNEYVNGKILDPENGTEYNCKLWMEDGDLMLRGYVAFFYRTQRWKAVKE